MNPQHSRYNRAVRRSQLAAAKKSSIGAKAVVTGALLVFPVGCGSGDEAVFADVSTPVSTTADPVADATTSPTTIPAQDPQTTVSAAAVAAGFPTGGEMLVSFTYAPASSGEAKRPYVAVWVEDPDGNLVDTISLWFEQGRRGTKWLSDLSQWSRASGGADTTVSGATRVAGDYTVAWDGTDANGDPVPAGEYVLNIESAREHGPSSFTTVPVVISDQGFNVTLDDNGELSGASAALAV